MRRCQSSESLQSSHHQQQQQTSTGQQQQREEGRRAHGHRRSAYELTRAYHLKARCWLVVVRSLGRSLGRSSRSSTVEREKEDREREGQEARQEGQEDDLGTMGHGGGGGQDRRDRRQDDREQRIGGIGDDREAILCSLLALAWLTQEAKKKHEANRVSRSIGTSRGQGTGNRDRAWDRDQGIGIGPEDRTRRQGYTRGQDRRQGQKIEDKIERIGGRPVKYLVRKEGARAPPKKTEEEEEEERERELSGQTPLFLNAVCCMLSLT